MPESASGDLCSSRKCRLLPTSQRHVIARVRAFTCRPRSNSGTSKQCDEAAQAGPAIGIQNLLRSEAVLLCDSSSAGDLQSMRIQSQLGAPPEVQAMKARDRSRGTFRLQPLSGPGRG